MAKTGSKYKLGDIIPLQNILDAVDSSTNDILLKIGRSVGPEEYAVRFYNDKRQPIFYINEEKLRYAIKKIISISSFNHWEQVIDILYKNNALELNHEQISLLNEKLYGIVSDAEFID